MYNFTTQHYFEKFEKLIIKSNERLEKYLEDPNEENVHDVRTSIRRLDAAWKVLPKKFKSQKAAKFVLLRKEFFKINSDIRDFDIIRQKLEPHSSENIISIMKKINAEKQKLLKSAQKKARAAFEANTMKIDQDKIPQEKLENKFKKITLQLINEIENSIPIVINNNKKIKQLHELRKDCKKLRYLLELTNHEDSSNLINKIKEMQDILGSIRDCDITIDFLAKQSKKHNLPESIIQLELEKRDQLYKKFVQMQKL
jgi:CHAD domain-containing protein